MPSSASPAVVWALVAAEGAFAVLLLFGPPARPVGLAVAAFGVTFAVALVVSWACLGPRLPCACSGVPRERPAPLLVARGEVLREAGVVYLGALGVPVLMEGVAAAPISRPASSRRTDQAAAPPGLAGHEASCYRFCTTFVVEGESLDLAALSARLAWHGGPPRTRSLRPSLLKQRAPDFDGAAHLDRRSGVNAESRHTHTAKAGLAQLPKTPFGEITLSGTTAATLDAAEAESGSGAGKRTDDLGMTPVRRPAVDAGSTVAPVPNATARWSA